MQNLNRKPNHEGKQEFDSPLRNIKLWSDLEHPINKKSVFKNTIISLNTSHILTRILKTYLIKEDLTKKYRNPYIWPFFK